MNQYANEQRSNLGFLGTTKLMENLGEHNVILDVHSTLVSESVEIGKGNILYPGTIIECADGGRVTIGSGNVFYPGVYIFCSDGEIRIGDDNTFGPAGVTMRANTLSAFIQIGSGGRYSDGANIMGETNLGSGSQILGNITVQNCILSGGGTFQEPEPDSRAAVLKGYGLARKLSLGVGDVVNGVGDFAKSPVERQSFYHPKKSG